MELVLVLRLLWRRRLLLLAGLIAACGAAFALGASPTPSRGYAQTTVVFDTPQSQLVEGAPSGAETLPWRASVATVVLGTEDSRQRLAQEIGVTPDQLAVTDLDLTAPYTPASLPTAAMQSANVTPEPYTLTLKADGSLPLISISTSAPDAQHAARLVVAAIHAMQAAAPRVDTKTQQAFTISQASSVDAVQVPGGKGRKRMVMVVVGLFGMWCTALVLVPLVAGTLRTLQESESLTY